MNKEEAKTILGVATNIVEALGEDSDNEYLFQQVLNLLKLVQEYLKETT